MGDIADMMLAGILCEGCGDFLGDDVGHPRRCASCGPITLRDALNRSLSGAQTPRARRAERHNRERREVARAKKPFECRCGRLCRTADGLAAHQRAKNCLGVT